jgi:hydroxylysine kinase
MTHPLELFMATMVGHTESIAPEVAVRVVRDHYGLQATAERLTGERDENFRMQTASGAEYVLKIANAAEDADVTDVPGAAMLHVESVDPELPCPRVCRNRDGLVLTTFTDESGARRAARLVTWLPGTPLRFAQRSARQRAHCGYLAARLGRALRDFSHPAAHRSIGWDLRNIPHLVGLLADLPRLPQAAFVSEFIAQFASRVSPQLAQARHQFLHNDLNDRNILVARHDPDRIAGLIDFGDAIHTALIADVAIACVAQIGEGQTPGPAVLDFVRAYHAVEPLTAEELCILNWLIAGIFVTVLLIPSWHRALNPG